MIYRFLITTIILFLLGLYGCRQGSCSTEDANEGKCENSFIDKTTSGGTPIGISPQESEPNDIFSDADVIIQTKQPDGSLNYLDNSFSMIGTVNSDVDEDWYRITIAGSDFDRLDASRTGCSTDGANLTTKQANFAQCFSSIAGRPLPVANEIPDHKEIVTSNGDNHKFFKPRFIIRVESPDQQVIALRVQVYSPTLSVNFNGALSEPPIADSYLHVSDTTNTLEGTLRQIPAAGNLSTPFPVTWQSKVRVSDLDLNDLFYNGCYVTSATTNPTPVKSNRQTSYNQLIVKDINAFRISDPYQVGNYYVKVSSSGSHNGKRYRIKWFWNTGRAIDGGISEWPLRAIVGSGPLNGTNTNDRTEDIAYSYFPDDRQTEGATTDGALPVENCNASGDYYVPTTTPTKPYCNGQFLAPSTITCNNAATPATNFFCYNHINIKTTGATTSPLDKCVADGNRDGFITPGIGDVGCIFDTSACNANGGYDESKRYCDCYNTCVGTTGNVGAAGSSITAGSNLITNIPNTALIYIGYQLVSNASLPAGTVVTKVIDQNTVRVSNNATANGNNFTFSPKPVGCLPLP